MDEPDLALVDGKLEVTDRQHLELVKREQGFQLSGDVSDETAVSIGKILGAGYVITGQLVKAGGRYRYRASAINVETAALENLSGSMCAMTGYFKTFSSTSSEASWCPQLPVMEKMQSPRKHSTRLRQ
jgi:hypothetical protein